MNLETRKLFIQVLNGHFSGKLEFLYVWQINWSRVLQKYSNYCFLDSNIYKQKLIHLNKLKWMEAFIFILKCLQDDFSFSNNFGSPLKNCSNATSSIQEPLKNFFPKFYGWLIYVDLYWDVYTFKRLSRQSLILNV